MGIDCNLICHNFNGSQGLVLNKVSGGNSNVGHETIAEFRISNPNYKFPCIVFDTILHQTQMAGA